MLRASSEAGKQVTKQLGLNVESNATFTNYQSALITS